jgi:AraC-like DNA-binding protein
MRCGANVPNDAVAMMGSVLACLGDDGWQCDDVRVARVAAAQPLHFAAGVGGFTFHWVEGAGCIVASAGAEEVLVEPGSLIATAAADAHTLRAAGGAAQPWALSMRWPSSPWLQALVLEQGRIFAWRKGAGSFPDALRLLRCRIMDGDGEAVPDALSKAAARAIAAQAFAAIESDGRTGRLSHALADARLGPWFRKALSATGPLPSLDDSARACHLSRAAFTRRFHELMDVPPTDFLVSWRMNLALHRLALARDTVADLAERCGYQSEAAFRKAFRRATGVAPGAVRASHGIDAVFGHEPVLHQGADGATPRLRERAAPRVTITTHEGPPELEALLRAVISNL